MASRTSGHTSIRDCIPRLVASRIETLQLDLQGLHVLTEAATGAYAVTAAMAAVAGAEVTALARSTRYGSAGEASEQVLTLAAELNVASRIRIVEMLTAADIQRADIVTNSGHLRPLDAAFIGKMQPGAAIPLMYEAWERRATDIDLDACRAARISVGGTNEQHPAVGVFDFLGRLVLQAVLGAGHDLRGEHVLLISDNSFAPYIRRTLEASGGHVYCSTDGRDGMGEPWNIVVIAATPPLAGGCPVDVQGLRARLFCQLWGDVPERCSTARWVPESTPAPGHMGLKLESLGPAPIVRLQAAGLKCGEVMLRPNTAGFGELLQPIVIPEPLSSPTS